MVAGATAQLRDTGTVNADRPHESVPVFLNLPVSRGTGDPLAEEVTWHCDFFPAAIRELVAEIGQRPGRSGCIFSNRTLADGSPALARMADRYEAIGVTTARRSQATTSA